MVPALQAKLLRVLEEKAFKRVGGAARHPRRRARHRRHQPQPRGAGARPGTSGRTCTTGSTCCRSSCRRCGRTSRTCPRSSRFYVDEFNREFRKTVRGASPAALKALQALRLAGQHPRAAQRRRARDAARRRRLARAGGLPGADAARRRSRAGSSCRPRASTSRTSSGAWSCRRSSARRQPDARGRAARAQPRSDPLPDREVRPRRRRPPRLPRVFSTDHAEIFASEPAFRARTAPSPAPPGRHGCCSRPGMPAATSARTLSRCRARRAGSPVAPPLSGTRNHAIS